MSGRTRRPAILILSGLCVSASVPWFAWLLHPEHARLAVPALAVLSFPVLIFALFMIRRLHLVNATIATILGWTVAALVVGNFLVVGHGMNWGRYRFDDATGWYPHANLLDHEFEASGIPYRVSTDEYGHRNRHPYPADGRLPFMVQGDSNLFGFGLDESVTLSEVLRRETGQAFFNFGVSGFDVNNYYFQYEQFREVFRPGRRIIFFNIGNDFGCSALRSPYFARRPYLTVTAGGDVVEVTDDRNRIHEQAYGRRFLPRYAEHDATIAAADGGMDWGEACPDWIGRVPVARFLAHYVGPRLRRLFVRYTEDEIERGLYACPYYAHWLVLEPDRWPSPYREYGADFPKILARVQQQMEPDADRLLVCLYPARLQVLDAEFSRLRRHLVDRIGDVSSIDRFAFNGYMIDLCDRMGIDVVDTSPAFMARSSDERERLFMTDDPHLSAEGLALCATTLARYLEGQDG